MNIQLHTEILKLDKRFQEEEKQGVYISDHQRVYEYNLLYSEAISRFHYLDEIRKIIKDTKHLEYKKNESAKTDKIAEAMARTSEEHKQCVEECRVYEKLKCQLYAKICYITGGIEAKKRKEILDSVEKKYNSHSGEGQH